MFKKKLKVEVVPESEYTDFSERQSGKLNGALVAGSAAVSASLATYAISSASKASQVPPIPAVEQVAEIAPSIDPVNVWSLPSAIPVSAPMPDVIQTGLIADSSLNMLATVLDPLVQILVAISFPIASVIMVGACFFFMLGNSEKAWQTIFNAGLGYVLIQMSPLFLNILREIGKAV